MLALWIDGETVATITLPTSLAVSLAHDLLTVARNRMGAQAGRWSIADDGMAGDHESSRRQVTGAARCEALQTLPIWLIFWTWNAAESGAISRAVV
jgi:hypothetical protein